MTGDEQRQSELKVLAEAVQALNETRKAEENNDLARAVISFMGAQKVWNEQHDKRSKDTLDSIYEEQKTIKGTIKEIQVQVSNQPCADQNKKIAVLTKAVEDHKESVNTRFQWVWGGLVMALLIMAVKSFLLGK